MKILINEPFSPTSILYSTKINIYIQILYTSRSKFFPFLHFSSPKMADSQNSKLSTQCHPSLQKCASQKEILGDYRATLREIERRKRVGEEFGRRYISTSFLPDTLRGKYSILDRERAAAPCREGRGCVEGGDKRP